MMSGFVNPTRTDSSHHRLYHFVKAVLINIFVHPYATVCELYCGGGADSDKWNEAQIGHYIGIDVLSSGNGVFREAWESQRKACTVEFCDADPCVESIELHLLDRGGVADVVCCLQHLQLCFEAEEKARKLLHNVSYLLKSGGYFFGITPDSPTIWAKYQKNVEAHHNKSSSLKPNIVPNSIRSESYAITFEVEEEKFPLFGKKYQLKISGDVSAESHCLVHFPSLIRLAREAGLEYVEIQNLTEFYDDNKAQFSGMLQNCGVNLVDPKGRLLPRAYDVLGLYTTFIFRKPNLDISPPIMTPSLPDETQSYDENFLCYAGSFSVVHRLRVTFVILACLQKDRQYSSWRDDEKNGHVERPFNLAKITEQKGILGPGPAELRFSEAL